ncbi:FAD-binding oxidoreductase, partial [Streptomyces zaomyceticus]|uniref:FAD-binding oxidoreductase n=1 Tax=Streptomyces zaomyceticus TaxID=68286 RepID=UPI0036BECE7F
MAATGARLSLRSGGHGISGRSTNHGGIVVDLADLSQVRVLDATTGLVRVGAGARWGDVARTLAPHGLALSSGDTGDVGVGGLATAGGIGLMSRLHGLTIDHIKAVDLVRADGELIRADAEHHPDLFWAMRGAGANFGVATAFEFQAQQTSDVIEAVTTYDATDTAGLLVRWGTTMEAAPRRLTSFLTLVPASGRIIGRAVTVYASADRSAAAAALRPLLAIAPVLGHQTTITPYHRLVPATHAPHYGQQQLSVVRSALFNHINKGVGEAVGATMATGQVMAQLRSIGGAVNDVDRSHTAYAHRTQNFSLMAATTPESEHVLDRRWADIRPYMNGLYLSFETGTSSNLLHAAFPGTT